MVQTSVKVDDDFDLVFPVRKLRETEDVEEKYFLTDSQIEKFKYLKGGKKIPIIKPNGETYTYSEGAMAFPDNWTNTGMTDKKKFFMMGYALVVGVIERIENEIDNIIEQEN